MKFYKSIVNKTDNSDLFKTRLNEAAKLNDTTVSELSSRTGIPRPTLYDYFKGRSNPSGYNLRMICGYFMLPQEFFTNAYVYTDKNLCFSVRNINPDRILEKIQDRKRCNFSTSNYALIDHAFSYGTYQERLYIVMQLEKLAFQLLEYYSYEPENTSLKISSFDKNHYSECMRTIFQSFCFTNKEISSSLQLNLESVNNYLSGESCPSQKVWQHISTKVETPILEFKFVKERGNAVSYCIDLEQYIIPSDEKNLRLYKIQRSYASMFKDMIDRMNHESKMEALKLIKNLSDVLRTKLNVSKDQQE